MSDDESPETPSASGPVEGPAAPEHAPPYLDRVHPPQLMLNGGPMTVFGASFHESCTLSFDDAPLAFERVDSTMLRAEAPPRNGPGVSKIVVTNPGGAQAIAMILYVSGPRIDRVVPAKVPRAGGVNLAIEGEGFTEGSCVTLFDDRAVGVEYDGPTRLRFVAPPRKVSPSGAIAVTNPDGTHAYLERAFEYVDPPPPSIASVEPSEAWVTGGARLTLRGAGFARGAVVTLGGVQIVPELEAEDALVIVAPPAEQAGPVAVRVSNPDGGAAERSDLFRYVRAPAPPKLIELSPREGPTAGGQTLLLVGDNFDEATVVRLGEVTCVARVLSPTRLEIETPPRGEPGAVAIELVKEGVAVRFESVYVYESRRPPRITSVTPTRGPVSGGTRLVIDGENFGEDCTVRIGREPAGARCVRSANCIEVLTPPAKTAGITDVEVIARGLPPAVAKSAFQYEAQPPPVITSVAPNRGGTNGGTELSIEGKAFTAGCTVLVGGKQAPKVKVISQTTIEALTPPGTHGQLVDVVVKNADGKDATARRAFQYDDRYR